jgi:predicted DsbA family dithiol-disulfide isomerase
MRIDFVSDVVCPWCAVGLASLERALERLEGVVRPELHLEPIELNPQMAAEGEDNVEHLSRKYGIGPAQIERNREAIRARGAEVGFAFGARDRTWNTFDAHRLLHWAGLEGRQRELKHALLRAYHGAAQNIGDPAVLARLAGEAGLDVERGRALLASDEFSTEVRERERYWLARGIHAVPAVVIDERHLISGGQPVEVFERALRQLAAGG